MEEQNRNKETAPGEARRPSSVEEAEAAIEAVLFAMGDPWSWEGLQKRSAMTRRRPVGF